MSIRKSLLGVLLMLSLERRADEFFKFIGEDRTIGVSETCADDATQDAWFCDSYTVSVF